MGIVVRPLREEDILEARHILSRAFGTFIGLPDPTRFAADQDYVRTRWRADPDAAFAAEDDGRLIGLRIRHALGQRRLLRADHRRRALLGPRRGAAAARADHGLLRALGHAPRRTVHVRAESQARRPLLQVRFLAALAHRDPGQAGRRRRRGDRADAAAWWRATFSAASAEQKTALLEAARRVADSVYPGLDLEQDIRAADEQRLGDTVLLRDRNGELEGFAVCHVGAETEAGEGVAYVKFGSVSPGAGARRRFDRLLDAVEALRGRARRCPGPGRDEHGARPRVSRHARARLPRRLPGRRHAPAQRSGLQQAGDLRHRRLAVATDQRVRRTFQRLVVMPRATRRRDARPRPRRGAVYARRAAGRPRAARRQGRHHGRGAARGASDRDPRRRDRGGRLERRDRALRLVLDARSSSSAAGWSFPASSRAMVTSWASATR